MSAPTDAELTERTNALVESCRDFLDDQVRFRGAQFDAGLALVHLPEGAGGLGGNRGQQAVIDAILRANGVTYEDLRINPIGIGMGLPTVLAYGSDELKEKHLRRIFTGEDIWCQLFSEPTHGSDVAGIPSRAVRDGDEWVVNGQKVWTTLAHLSRWGMLVARTDPDQPKHKGLTYFVVDMQAPGVDVRPLRQMTGDAEFNEVYFTDVRIPDAERLGDIGEGWGVSLTTLMNERVSIGGTVAPRGSGYIATAVREFTAHSDAMGEAERIANKDELMKLWVRAEVVRLTNIRASENRKLGNPGPEGSVGKLASAELNKDVTAFTMNLMGPDAFLYGDYTMRRPETAADASTPQRGFLRMRANSIEGGTTEIMKNILGEQVLGLPGEPRTDKDVPWIDVPRG